MRSKPPTGSQLRIIWFALTALAIAVIIAVVVAFVWGFGKVLNLFSPVLWPLAIAAVAAYLLEPAVYWLEKRKIKRPWGIVIVFVATLSILGGVLASVIPQLVDETNQLISKIPKYTAHAQQKFEDWAKKPEKAEPSPQINQTATASDTVSTNSANSANSTNSTNSTISTTNSTSLENKTHQIKTEILSSATSWLSDALPKIGTWFLNELAKATALIDVAIALVLIPVYAFYFLREKRWIKNNWANYLPIRDSRLKEEIAFVLGAINQYMVAFFRGQVLVALCNGVMYTIGFLLIGLDYAFLLGFFAVLLTMIPFLGAIINCILALTLTAVQFSDWFHPLMVLVVFAVVQSLESFLVTPKIMGHRVGLHPAVIIVAVMVGITLLGGILGGILAIPLAAALRVLMFRYVWKDPEQAENLMPK